MIGMFRWLRRWFGPAPRAEDLAQAMPLTDDTGSHADPEPAGMPAPAHHDAELLERARMQWQFGDWESLTALDIQSLEPHPERAKLALLVAAAWQQMNDVGATRRFLRHADEWGCDKKLIARLLISGVHNTLGRAAALNQDDPRVRAHFRAAIAGVSGDPELASQVRTAQELSRMRVFPNASGNFHHAQLRFQPASGVIDADEVPAFSRPAAGITSYAQNFEDVMLWRALGHIPNGCYIDIGAQDPIVDSVSKAFYEHGWRGIHVEAVPAYAALLRQDRPDERVVQAAVTAQPGPMEFFEFPETGISTGIADIAQEHAGRGGRINTVTVSCLPLADVLAMANGQDIHWLKIDVEGMEADVLASWGNAGILPWVLVIESTKPLTQIDTSASWRHYVLELGYREVYFDGINRFYLSAQHAALAAAFATGPNIFDAFSLSDTVPYVRHAPAPAQPAA